MGFLKNRLSVAVGYLLVIATVLSAVFWGSRAVTVISETRPIERNHCIVIDAGHGGEDGGATSCTGKLESAFNLEIALRLRDLFHLLGYETKMIRTGDISVYTKGETIAQKKVSDLKERARIINETDNGILVSIHQNQFSDSRYYGAQVFYAGTEGSDRLAKSMQDMFVQTLNPGSTRKSKRAEGIYLMEHIECTGVLVECGFLSNPEEEARLRQPEYQKMLCCVVSTSVCEYLEKGG